MQIIPPDFRFVPASLRRLENYVAETTIETGQGDAEMLKPSPCITRTKATQITQPMSGDW